MYTTDVIRDGNRPSKVATSSSSKPHPHGPNVRAEPQKNSCGAMYPRLVAPNDITRLRVAQVPGSIQSRGPQASKRWSAHNRRSSRGSTGALQDVDYNPVTQAVVAPADQRRLP